MEGDITINGQSLNKRDGLGLVGVENLEITAENDAKILLMDVPMR
jgi:hypothetical protein